MNKTSQHPIDVIYVAASSRDGRYARICVASIRHFYPEKCVKLLVGGPLTWGLARELARYWNVGIADIAPGDWGWGFVKLEPLFRPAGERFLVLDSDTVLTGKILEPLEESPVDFIVDEESQSDDDSRRLYYEWCSPNIWDEMIVPPLFTFNTGQWIGTSGILTREDFTGLVDWEHIPPILCRPDLFKNGDQGVLNYVINRGMANCSLGIARHKLMRWPGNGLGHITAEAVRSGEAPALVIHWAGMKAMFLRDMVGGDLLQFYEDFYYTRLPAGRMRRIFALWHHVLINWSFKTFLPARIFLKRWRDSMYPRSKPAPKAQVRS